jgi:hypothetical protein
LGEAAARALLAGDETGLPIPVVESHTEKMAALRTLGHEMAARMVHLVAGRI